MPVHGHSRKFKDSHYQTKVFSYRDFWQGFADEEATSSKSGQALADGEIVE
jgi:hypothetical protein